MFPWRAIHSSRHFRRNQSIRIFETLEDRRMLSADLAAKLYEDAWLTLSPDQYAKDSILVRFRDDPVLFDHAFPNQFRQNGLLGTSPKSASTFIPGLTTVELDSHVSVAEALAAYRASPDVLYAEPNYRIQVEQIPDDIDFYELWGLNNTGQTGGTFGADIDAPEAWDVTTGSGNTIVAVIDTGVDYTHPDLQANMWVNMAELNGTPFVDDDGNGYLDDIHGFDFANNDGDPMDDHNHGTHVAGTIGAVGNNSLGVTGVNWDVQIMAIKFLDAGGGGNLGDAIQAIDYAIANGANISNNSWGFNGAFSPTLFDAIQNARDAGHIFAAAAGNGNFQGIGLNNDITPFYPANFNLDNVVSVAALDHNNALASFSNYGLTTVDLGAPGVGILSTTRNGTYRTFNGTSMATPHVAGVIALVWDLHPEWSYQQVIDAVLESAVPTSSLAGRSVSGGRLNASQTVNFSGPEIRVLHDGLIINDGIGTIDFGDVLPGLQNAETFTIQNVGLDDLQLLSPIQAQTGFTISAQPAVTTLAPGASTTFEVAIADVPLGSYEAEVSWLTNDSSESLFSFNVMSHVTNVLIVDDGDSSFDAIGSWTHWLNEGLDDDMTYKAAGDGTALASWDFNVTPGQYAIAATWPVHENRANDSPFMVLDGTNQLMTVRVDQEQVPNDFVEHGVGWEELGTFSITGDSLLVQLTNDANEFVIADGLRIERLGDLPTGPEIEVSYAGALLVDGQGSVDLGSGFFESTVTREFSVRNVGQAELHLDSEIELPTGFSLVSAPQGTLTSGESTTFTIALDTSLLRAHTGVLSIASNDADEGSFNFTISGRVVTSRITDDGDPGFATNGDWTDWSSEGYASDMHYSPAGTGVDTATWTFEVTPGEYSVAATWPPQINRATNAPFKISDGSDLLSTITLNQELAPNDFTDEGASWEFLGSYTISGNMLSVELTDAANENVIADAVRIQRLDLPPAPEVELSIDGMQLAAGTGSVDFGGTIVHAPVTRTFTVTNVGDADLALLGSISVPNGFSATPWGASVLAPGESTSFEVELNATSEGAFGGWLSFGTDDADEPLYGIQLSGSASQVLRIDNGETGFAISGAWTPWLSEGFAGDMHYSAAGSGFDRASWTFSVAPGEYVVAATWPSQPNRATNSPFSVRDGSDLLAKVEVNQELAPNDFAADGASWKSLGTFLVSGSRLSVELTDEANEYVIADAIRIERVGDLPAGPEIVVQIDGVSIEDGIGQIDFGVTSVGVPVSRTFTIQNLGAGTLMIDSQLELPDGYRLSSPPVSTLASGESTTFEVQLDGLTLGTLTGQLAMVTNDADENPFEFLLTGVVSTTKVIDNGDPGFSTSGDWLAWSGEGFAGDMHYSAKGNGADRATWTFQLSPGQYSVAATWPPQRNRATDAPFTIRDGAHVLANVAMNQEIAPNDFASNGTTWEMLGTFLVTGSMLTVELSDAANEYVIADAVRIERLSELPTGPEIVVQSSGVSIEDGVGLVEFGTTVLGVPVSRSFTVQNVGQANLLLGSHIDLPGGFTLLVPPGSNNLASGESTTFVIQFDGLSPGTTTGTLAMLSNDADESPFDILLVGDVSSATIIDNGDEGFHTDGSWSPWESEGFENDIHYSAKGSGADTASWTFSVAPGRYTVAAAWAPKANRATNAPYTIFDSGNPLATILVNQELSPSDLIDQGTGWKILGEFEVQGDSLVIVLSDAANDYVIADAIRIESSGTSAFNATAAGTSIPPAAVDEVFRREYRRSGAWVTQRRVQDTELSLRRSPDSVMRIRKSVAEESPFLARPQFLAWTVTTLPADQGRAQQDMSQPLALSATGTARLKL